MTQRTRGRKWMTIRHAVLTLEPRCVECRNADRISLATEVDHIVPLHKGGTDELTNLRGLCVDHHLAKTRADRGLGPKRIIGNDGWPE